MRITFYPITNFTWHTKEWRFFLYRNNYNIYLYDNIDYKVYFGTNQNPEFQKEEGRVSIIAWGYLKQDEVYQE